MVTKQRHIILVGAAICGFLGCQESQRGLSTPVRANCGGSQFEQLFGGVFDGLPREAEMPRFAELLSAAGEPSLSCNGNRQEAYRITLASPDGVFTAIRAEELGADRHAVSIVMLDTASRQPISRSTRELRAADFEKLSTAVRAFDFWSRAPSYSSMTTRDPGLVVLDGGSWIFEGREGSWYHAIARGPTPRERAFSLVAKQMFALAGVDLPGEFNVPRF